MGWCGCHEILILCSATALSWGWGCEGEGEFAPHPFTHQDPISCVSNSCLTLISKRFPYHLHRHSGCLETSLYQGKRLLQGTKAQSRFRGTRTRPYTPGRYETGYPFRDTRSTLYTPVNCRTVHFSRGTSIERERLLVLCSEQQQAEMQ